MCTAHKMPYVATSLADTALPSSLAVTGHTFHYSGHTHALYQRQGP